MPLLGAHMSIAGGLFCAFDRLGEVGGEALQIFSRNQRQWKADVLDAQSVELFRRKWEESGRMPVAVHSSYLVNLAECDCVRAQRAVEAFADEVRRTAALGIDFLIVHPGFHLGQGIEAGIRTFAHNLDRSLDLAAGAAVSVLLETTAGQGTGLGSTFEQIAAIIETSRYEKLLGVCFDTCHCFAAGYDLRSAEAYRDTFTRFESILGLDRLKFFHLNDSKKGLGSKVDRHEHIGKGEIGLEGFRLLLNDPRFSHHPMVLETPKGKDLQNDKENLRTLRSLLFQALPVSP